MCPHVVIQSLHKNRTLRHHEAEHIFELARPESVHEVPRGVEPHFQFSSGQITSQNGETPDLPGSYTENSLDLTALHQQEGRKPSVPARGKTVNEMLSSRTSP